MKKKVAPLIILWDRNGWDRAESQKSEPSCFWTPNEWNIDIVGVLSGVLLSVLLPTAVDIKLM